MTAPGPRGDVHLLGGLCRDCGARMFPVRRRCVSCYGTAVTTVPLPRLGVIECHSVVHQAPAGYQGPVPYALGQIRLSDGVTVLAQLAGKAESDWRGGEAVASYALPLASPDGPVYGFCFRPRAAGDADEQSG